ncbi:MAG: virulence protein, partial [Lachnospiraceae bacterium]|nr:virulence protein [Lachnospiraceae bacterium]
TISVPFDSADTLLEYRITKLINAKSKLFMKAFNTEKLDFEIKDDTITFRWLSGDATPEMIQASMKFFSLLVKLVKEGSSVKCKEREIHSEKYAMRCFLVRLGFIGDEFKKDRKLLMQNLSGSSAFRLKDGKSND